VGSELGRREWEEAVLRGPSLTLLLPLGGQKGHCSLPVSVPTAGLSRHALLTTIANFYQVGSSSWWHVPGPVTLQFSSNWVL